MITANGAGPIAEREHLVSEIITCHGLANVIMPISPGRGPSRSFSSSLSVGLGDNYETGGFSLSASPGGFFARSRRDIELRWEIRGPREEEHEKKTNKS